MNVLEHALSQEVGQANDVAELTRKFLPEDCSVGSMEEADNIFDCFMEKIAGGQAAEAEAVRGSQLFSDDANAVRGSELFGDDGVAARGTELFENDGAAVRGSELFGDGEVAAYGSELFGNDADEIPEAEPGAIFKEFGFDKNEFIRRSVEAAAELDEKREDEFRELYEEFSDEELYYHDPDAFSPRLYYARRGGPNCYFFALGYAKNPLTGETLTKKPVPGELACANMEGVDIDEAYADYMYPLMDGNAERGKEGLIRWIGKDLETVGKELVEVDSKDYIPKEGETLIYMCWSEQYNDFHFMRKGDYGTWYHKQGLMDPSDEDLFHKKILDPEDCARQCGYEVNLGYYVIRDKEV